MKNSKLHFFLNITRDFLIENKSFVFLLLRNLALVNSSLVNTIGTLHGILLQVNPQFKRAIKPINSKYSHFPVYSIETLVFLCAKVQQCGQTFRLNIIALGNAGKTNHKRTPCILTLGHMQAHRMYCPVGNTKSDPRTPKT